MNTLGQRPFEELAAIVFAVEVAAKAREVRGLVLMSGKESNFIAGADIKEFDAFETEEQVAEAVKAGTEIFDRIERLSVPVVAAIHGFCLGGGLELAMACHYRIADREDGTRLGLPEVKLGLFPGLNGTVDPAVTVEPVPLRREAEPFERLRDAGDAHLERTGQRPMVFLANLGSPSDFTARTTYAQSLFAAGGIEAIASDGLAAPADAAEAFKTSGARIACLCSSDAVYGTMAEDVARALDAAGAAHLYLAGRPGDAREAYGSAGVKAFIHKGCDIIETLQAAHDLLGLRPAA